MRIQVGGEEMVLRFRHQLVGRRRGTSASLFVRGTNTDRLIAHGEAECSRQDQYVKEVGRRLALTRALDTFSRPMRAQIWAAYNGRKEQARSIGQ